MMLLFRSIDIWFWEVSKVAWRKPRLHFLLYSQPLCDTRVSGRSARLYQSSECLSTLISLSNTESSKCYWRVKSRGPSTHDSFSYMITPFCQFCYTTAFVLYLPHSRFTIEVEEKVLCRLLPLHPSPCYIYPVAAPKLATGRGCYLWSGLSPFWSPSWQV